MPSFGYLASARSRDCRPTLFINEYRTLPPMPRVNDISKVYGKQNVKATLIYFCFVFQTIGFCNVNKYRKTILLTGELDVH